LGDSSTEKFCFQFRMVQKNLLEFIIISASDSFSTKALYKSICLLTYLLTYLLTIRLTIIFKLRLFLLCILSKFF